MLERLQSHGDNSDHVGVGVDVLEADHLRRHELRGADHGPDQSEATIEVT